MKRALRSPGANGRQGSILLLVCMLMATMATLSLAMVFMIRGFHGEHETTREELGAQYVAEAGLSDALAQLRNGGDGNVGSEEVPVQYGPGGYWVEATDLGGDQVSLTATGIDDRAVSRVELILSERPTSFFRWAAFADESLRMDSDAQTDSYDSALGPYAAQASGSGADYHAKEKGHVGSNGPISMYSNTKVWGNATAGPGNSTSINGNATVSGSTTPMDEPVAFPPIVVPPGGPGADLTVNLTGTIGPGTFFFNTLKIDGNATLNIVGPTTLVMRNLTLGSNAKLVVVPAAGGLTAYVRGNFELDSNATISSLTQTPADVAFNLSSVPGNSFKLGSNTKFYGTIYAPRADISAPADFKIDSNAEIFGAVVADRLELNSNARIHYDEALGRMGGGGDPEYEILSWRVLAQP